MRVPCECECEERQADGAELGVFADWRPQGPSTLREADSELFSVSQLGVSSRLLTTFQTARQTHVKWRSSSSGIKSESSKKDMIRIEELNYKARFLLLFHLVKLTVL